MSYIPALDAAIAAEGLAWPAAPSPEAMNQYIAALTELGTFLRAWGGGLRKHPTREAWLIATLADLYGNLLLDFVVTDGEGHRKLPDDFAEGLATIANMAEELRNTMLQSENPEAWEAEKAHAREVWIRKGREEHIHVFKLSVAAEYDTDAIVARLNKAFPDESS